jgi:hypothetical protein
MGRIAAAIADARRAKAVEFDASRERVRDDAQVRALPRRPQISACDRGADAAAAGLMVVAAALLVRAVEIVVARHARLDAGADVRVAESVAPADRLHRQRAAGAMKLARPEAMILRLAKVRQDVLE